MNFLRNRPEIQVSQFAEESPSGTTIKSGFLLYRVVWEPCSPVRRGAWLAQKEQGTAPQPSSR